jgi:peptide/nickel transport system substrate-binding protein
MQGRGREWGLALQRPRRRRRRSFLVAVSVGLAAASGLACGGTSVPAGSATVLMGTAPDSLDPQLGFSFQSVEPDWITYTPLLTYRHASGVAGTQLIPGLASDLPTVSPDGKTYVFMLRRGLVYSDGRPVRASDFVHAIERALKLNWGGKAFLTGNIVGAAAYDKGQAKTITGISADDASGKITVQLLAPYGAFANVAAFPATAPVPGGTPMTNQNGSPPPGVGAYEIKNVVPNKSFTLVKNPRFQALHIPGIPAGSLSRIQVNITSSPQVEAQQVLGNQADAFDPGDTIPAGLLSEIQAKASSRFARETLPSTYYFFLNTTLKPFNSPLARQAVNYALDRSALVRLSGGFLRPQCFFLPEGLPGHPTGACAYGGLTHPDLTKAQQLIRQANLTGAPVTVWGDSRSPQRLYVDYYTNLLNKIGLRATEKIVAGSVYFATIGNAQTHAQTGYANWLEDFPNPADFYTVLDAKSITPVNNANLSHVTDPHIQGALSKLEPVPASQLSTAASGWQALDQYAAKQAYEAVFGEEELPKFLSKRIDFGSAVFHPLYLNDWSSWRLK